MFAPQPDSTNPPSARRWVSVLNPKPLSDAGVLRLASPGEQSGQLDRVRRALNDDVNLSWGRGADETGPASPAIAARWRKGTEVNEGATSGHLATSNYVSRICVVRMSWHRSTLAPAPAKSTRAKRLNRPAAVRPRAQRGIAPSMFFGVRAEPCLAIRPTRLTLSRSPRGSCCSLY